MYKIFKDKENNFSCKVDIEGANEQDSIARIMLQKDDSKFIMFEGKISNNEINIPLNIKKELNEGDKGKIILEVIAEDTVFKPWNDDFKIEVSKKVRIEEISSPSSNKKSKKQLKEVTVSFGDGINISGHLKKLKKLEETSNKLKKNYNKEKLFEIYTSKILKEPLSKEENKLLQEQFVYSK